MGQFLKWGLKNVDLVADMGEVYLDMQKVNTFVERNEILKPVQDRVAQALDDMPAFSAANEDELRAKMANALAEHYAKSGKIMAAGKVDWSQLINSAFQLAQFILPLLTAR
jgi:hypothetical protein